MPAQRSRAADPAVSRKVWMLIKLVQPRMTMRPMDTLLKPRMAPSLGLLTLAALTPAGHETVLADENVRALDLSDAPGLVGITANVDSADRAYAISDAYRRRGIPVVGGGIHVSAVPDEAAAHFDAICVGNAERLWSDIVRDAAAGTLRPRYQSTDQVEGAEIPAPRRDLVRQGDYLFTNTVSTSRGCPFRCEFCYTSCGYVPDRIANRPVADVLAEIDSLRTRHVMFIDDNFIGNPTWTREFLEALDTRHRRLTWNAAVSVNLVNQLPLLDLMAKTGCHSLFVGFETINQSALRDVSKRQNRVDAYGRLIEEIHGRGIMVNASLVFGLDGDDASMFRATMEWLVAHRVETMTGHILTPYPGTVLHRRLEAEGRIVDTDKVHYNTAHVVYQPLRMNADELRAGYLWMYREFYSSRNIWRRMPRSRRQRAPYLLFNIGYRRFGWATALLARFGLLTWVGRLARRLAYHVE
jgi:radical SAM superfamily enzyme YgiQ (UPF0313 family)